MAFLTRARRKSAAAAAAGLVFALAGVAQAAALWTLTASPLVATAGRSTTFDLLAFNVAGPPSGCVNVEIPSSFVIQAVGSPVASDGSVWVSAVAGTWVEVTSLSGVDFLEPGESVRFSLQLLPTQSGTWNWNNHIHISNQCTGTSSSGAPVTVVVAPAILPTPAPTPVPTVVATLPPVPTPLPSVLPTALPSVLATTLPSLLPTTTPRPTPASTAAPTPTDRPASAGLGSGSSGGPGPAVRFASLPEADAGSSGLGTDVLARLDGQLLWFVPGAVVGVPGLLVLVWIGLQTIGALAWVPAVRRMSGDPLTVRRRRRPAE